MLMPQCNSQQRTCRNQMKLRHFFTEILQRSNCLRTCLNLIEDNQGFPRHDLSSKNSGSKILNDPVNIKVIGKQFSQRSTFFKIKVSIILELVFPKPVQNIRFPALANSCQQ